MLQRLHRLHIPNTLRILTNTPITRKEPHPRHRQNALPHPLLLILIRLIHQLLRLDIAIKVVRHQIVITVLLHRRDQGGEVVGGTKGVGADEGEDGGEGGVQGRGSVGVGVAQVFDVFGEVAEEEDVLLADFAGYFNLDGD
jgi:hypothetical protein